ncbi:DUF5959 family protein [Streptomyces aureus]
MTAHERTGACTSGADPTSREGGPGHILSPCTLRSPDATPPDDVDSWSRILGELPAGRDAVWTDDGRTPLIRFEPSRAGTVTTFMVEDLVASGTSVRVHSAGLPQPGGRRDSLYNRAALVVR